MKEKSKLIAVASVGGHWVQLLRLKKLFEKYDTVFVTTRSDFASMVDGPFYAISDFNRNDMGGFFRATISLIRIIRKEDPHIMITTGAAPGLLALIIGRFFGVKTIWLDSIANVEELSMSGRIASKFCSRVYTQWPDLATNKIVYAGNVLS